MNCEICGKEMTQDKTPTTRIDDKIVQLCDCCHLEYYEKRLKQLSERIEQHKADVSEIEDRMMESKRFWNKINLYTIVFGIIIVLWIYIFLCPEG